MEIPVFNLLGEEVKKIEMPKIFTVPVKQEVIRRVFIHQHTHRLQPKGRYPLAGRAAGAEYFGVGLGLARVPRLKQGPLRGRAAIVAMARGGRRPHVTTPEKKIYKELNKKERLLGIASAIAATANLELIKRRGHIIDNVPFIPLIVDDEIETISTAKEFRDFAIRIGILDDILRVRERIKRVGGKAKWRGRGKKIGKGPLIVYGNDRGIYKAARNEPGVDVVSAKDVSVIHLAPGGVSGRLTVWTESSLPIIEERLKYIINRVALYV